MATKKTEKTTKSARKSASGAQWTYAEREAKGKKMMSIYFDLDTAALLDALVDEDGSSRNKLLAELVVAEAARRDAEK